MKSTLWKTMLVAVALSAYAGVAQADSFGSGANQFDIDFVTISGDAAAANGTNISQATSPENDSYRTFSDPRTDFRIGTYEVTNDQWNKFAATPGVLPIHAYHSDAYDTDPYWTREDVPANNVSWYEAAQFVNYLNTSTGHQAAYKFTEMEGTNYQTFGLWSPEEAAGGTNLYRHKDAFYFLPTEDEWVKAAYWNGTAIQDYATKAGETLVQGDGVSGTGWNYRDQATYAYATSDHGPWEVGSGSEELNGTFDMMGNVWEWTESPYFGTSEVDAWPTLKGGSYYDTAGLRPVHRIRTTPDDEIARLGFRVASEVPEPMSVGLLSLGGLALLKRRNK